MSCDVAPWKNRILSKDLNMAAFGEQILLTFGIYSRTCPGCRIYDLKGFPKKGMLEYFGILVSDGLSLGRPEVELAMFTFSRIRRRI